MITIEERNELEALAKRLLQLLPRIDAVNRSCLYCAHGVSGFCRVHEQDIPDDFKGGCDSWEFSDIPF